MTREEAIKRFNGIIHSMSISVAQAKFYPTKAELNELCDMAIEALSERTGEWIGYNDAEVRNDRTYINEPYMQQSRHNDGRMTREEAISVIQEVFDNAELSHCGHYATALDMAIEALSEPIVCKDYRIDDDHIYCSPKMADRVVEALTNKWTPITVSEPNTSNHVLVTYKWDDDDYEVSELDYWVTKHEAERGNVQCKRLIDHVIAWRELPKPYREDGEV